MTVDQHPCSPTPPDSHLLDVAPAAGHPADLAAALRIRRFCYEPEFAVCGQDDQSPPPCEPITTEVPDDPAPHAAVHHLLLLVGQILNRLRPAAHLAEAAAPAVVRNVRAVTPVRGRVQVTSLHVCLPREDAADIVAVCRFSTHSYRVIAGRLDRRPSAGWRCTALRLL